ncbi:hypothetical protein BATDEDRAFT_28221 [Batrachochytrium dendrobatidis JAM81]|uniref:Uncharacterized protein n=1 Tax=Batrachochytrium dendrobatidis (strain JAM81 / FGSC 10211) TaxID=684364 RepID=F4PDC2_BATDJ|nr:uncharacterized protein BATDEDRAFT_28221 [Batrachochytrium dendrobatidis JAM81]EGF76658.1 hypothetical protein BATDEDRAFT_28221 [Batrachochytrium dendrobatidis JAM81]|eukprot:XP_006682594.1 hypothetical protein BATDEDRAFT_28221 [Batrachochytrium dendrobatidis JAM81]
MNQPETLKPIHASQSQHHETFQSYQRKFSKQLPAIPNHASEMTIHSNFNTDDYIPSHHEMTTKINVPICAKNTIQKYISQSVSADTLKNISQLSDNSDAQYYPLPSDSNASQFKTTLSRCLFSNTTAHLYPIPLETSIAYTKTHMPSVQSQLDFKSSDVHSILNDETSTHIFQARPRTPSNPSIVESQTHCMDISNTLPQKNNDWIDNSFNVPTGCFRQIHEVDSSKQSRHDHLIFSGTIISVTASQATSSISRWFQSPTRSIRCGMWTRKTAIHLEIRTDVIREMVLSFDGRLGSVIYSMPTCAAAFALLHTKQGKSRFLLKNTNSSTDPPRVFEVPIASTFSTDTMYTPHDETIDHERFTASPVTNSIQSHLNLATHHIDSNDKQSVHLPVLEQATRIDHHTESVDLQHIDPCTTQINPVCTEKKSSSLPNLQDLRSQIRMVCSEVRLVENHARESTARLGILQTRAQLLQKELHQLAISVSGY